MYLTVRKVSNCIQWYSKTRDLIKNYRFVFYYCLLLGISVCSSGRHHPLLEDGQSYKLRDLSFCWAMLPSTGELSSHSIRSTVFWDLNSLTVKTPNVYCLWIILITKVVPLFYQGANTKCFYFFAFERCIVIYLFWVSTLFCWSFFWNAVLKLVVI